jgi:hypothetical protein
MLGAVTIGLTATVRLPETAPAAVPGATKV